MNNVIVWNNKATESRIILDKVLRIFVAQREWQKDVNNVFFTSDLPAENLKRSARGEWHCGD